MFNRVLTAVGGEKTLRKAGTIYYVDGNIYQSQANFTTGTGSTTYVAGDTIVIDADHTSATEAYFKADLPYAKFRIAKDFAIHSGDNDAVLLANAEIEVVEGKTLTFNVVWSHLFKLGSATFTGAGTVVMEGILLNAATEAFTAEGWSGTVWLKNIGATGNNPLMDGRFAKLGRAGSTVKLSDCNGYIDMEGDFAFDLELDGTGWKNPSGYSARTHAFGALTGSGTLDGAAYATSFGKELLRFSDASSFTGSLFHGRLNCKTENSRPSLPEPNWNSESKPVLLLSKRASASSAVKNIRPKRASPPRG